jgi:hypothetical protein
MSDTSSMVYYLIIRGIDAAASLKPQRKIAEHSERVHIIRGIDAAASLEPDDCADAVKLSR